MHRQRQDIVAEQHQKLYLTPELRQGLSILGMNTFELREYLFDQVAENPFLEEREALSTDGVSESDTFVAHVNTDALTARMQPRQRSVSDGSYGEIKNEYSFEKYLTQTQTCEEYLEEQINIEIKNDVLRPIGRFLIGNLDPNGYLRIGVDEAAILLRTTPDQVKRALQVLQACEPAGIGARDLKECLLLQVNRRGFDNALVKAVIEHHLEDLASHRFQKIAKEEKTTIEEVEEVHDYLKTLDPRPGLRLPCVPTPSIRPEVLVAKEGDQYVAQMQEFDIPNLQISQEYLSLVKKKDHDQETEKYIAQNLKNAQGLIDSIEQRKLTIYKVARCIIRHQQSFFEQGIAGLKPLTMAQVAKEVDMHESTISRVVNGCYLQSDRGTFELRYFFHSGVGSSNSASQSSKSIKHQIKELISQEDPQNPLSDQQIEQALAALDIAVSRRTISKYRNQLGIAPALQRKRHQ